VQVLAQLFGHHATAVLAPLNVSSHGLRVPGVEAVETAAVAPERRPQPQVAPTMRR
jgi:hypothetical protein